jgi:DNA-directed RNA polymerase subunit E'/Rpb7
LKKNGILNGEIIEARDNGCFVLSDLEVITNPVQFDKVMDNHYFTLDNNAKKYVQYLVNEWTSLTNNKQD